MINIYIFFFTFGKSFLELKRKLFTFFILINPLGWMIALAVAALVASFFFDLEKNAKLDCQSLHQIHVHW